MSSIPKFEILMPSTYSEHLLNELQDEPLSVFVKDLDFDGGLASWAFRDVPVPGPPVRGHPTATVSELTLTFEAPRVFDQRWAELYDFSMPMTVQRVQPFSYLVFSAVIITGFEHSTQFDGLVSGGVSFAIRGKQFQEFDGLSELYVLRESRSIWGLWDQAANKHDPLQWNVLGDFLDDRGDPRAEVAREYAALLEKSEKQYQETVQSYIDAQLQLTTMLDAKIIDRETHIRLLTGFQTDLRNLQSQHTEFGPIGLVKKYLTAQERVRDQIESRRLRDSLDGLRYSMYNHVDFRPTFPVLFKSDGV